MEAVCTHRTYMASFSFQLSDSIAHSEILWYLIFIVQNHLLIPIRIKKFWERCCTKQRLSQFCHKALTVGQAENSTIAALCIL